MAHILWTILKIILIILGILLGLLLLAVLLLLFCPVRYRFHAAKTEEMKFSQAQADAGVSWLFGGAWVKVIYQDHDTDIKVRLFGIPLDKFLFGDKNEPKAQEKEPEAEESVWIQEEKDTVPEEKESLPEEPDTLSEAKDEPPALPAPEEEPVPDKDTAADSGASPKTSLFGKIKGVFTGIKDKAAAVLDQIRHTWATAAWWHDFIFDERTQEAIALVLREAGFLIRHVLPTRMWGEISFGSEDPSLTGRVTGAFAMTVPFHKNNVVLHPSFECRDFAAGELTAKGRVYGCAFVLAGLKILLSKNIRFVLKKLKTKNKTIPLKEE